MRDGKIAIEIDLKKLGLMAMLAVATALALYAGMGDTLLVIIPAGLACLIGKEERND